MKVPICTCSDFKILYYHVGPIWIAATAALPNHGRANYLPSGFGRPRFASYGWKKLKA
jgi:hypothetical protein